MLRNDFRKFCFDILLGIMLILLIFFLLNLSRIFDYNEKSSVPELLWRNFSQENFVKKPDILFTGNSQAYYLNPKILDSITQKSSYFFGYSGASIEILSWFFLNSWENINLDLVVLESHSFESYRFKSRIDSIRLLRWRNDYPRFNRSKYSFPYIPWNKINLSREFDFFYKDKLRLPYLVSGSAIANHHIFETQPSTLYKVLFSSNEGIQIGFRKSFHKPVNKTLQDHYENDFIPVYDRPIEQITLQKIEQIVSSCRARGVKVLVYESPMYYKHSVYQKRRYEQLDSICKRLKIPFVNLNIDTTFTRKPQYFENTQTVNQHLTSKGADEVSKLIADKILELNLIELESQ